jgi:uncharacterized membrane protein
VTTKSPPGRWKWGGNGLTSELWFAGKQIANVARVNGRYYYEVTVVGAPTITGWADSRYAAQRAVRRALKDAEAIAETWED